MSLILAIAAITLLLAIRGQWIVWQAERYGYLASYYCLRTRQSAEIVRDMTLVWPASRMLWELWNWDWRRYVVDHDSFDAMCVWMRQECQRTDLTWETYEHEQLMAQTAMVAEQIAALEKAALERPADPAPSPDSTSTQPSTQPPADPPATTP